MEKEDGRVCPSQTIRFLTLFATCSFKTSAQEVLDW
jgi:hypothetical protein